MLTRRDFIHAGCAAGAITLAPNFLDVAEARFPRGSAPSGFNGGKSQVNLNFLQGGGDFPFLNALKTAQAWSVADNTNNAVTPDILDTNGYPTTIVHGGVGTVFFVPTQASRPGNYVITWDGTGTILAGAGGSQLSTKTFTGSITGNVLAVPGTITGGPFQFGEMVTGGTTLPQTVIMNQIDATHYTVSQSQNVSSVSMTASGGSNSSSGGANAGFFACSVVTNAFIFKITAIGSSSNYISNVKVFHVADAALLQAGQVFGTKFKQRLIEANFGSIRFLNWILGNTNNITTWSTRKPQSYVFYDYELRQAFYAGVTTNLGNAYSTSFTSGLIHSSNGAAWTSGPPLQGDTVHILFNASATQSGTCSLDVGGAGNAKNILSEFSSPLSVGGNSYPIGGTFQSLATLVYDADINAWIKQGGDAAINSAGLNNGVPPELMVQLCAEVGAHLDIPMPVFAMTPMTDFATSLATYTRDHGPSWMIPNFEGPNELWNTATFITGYAEAKATAYGWTPNDFHNWYGKAMSTLGQAVSAVYGNDRTKYEVLCGIQTSTFDNSGDIANSNPRLASTQYLTQTPQAGFTLSPASDWVTGIRPANYISPSEYASNQEMLDAYQFSIGNTGVAASYVATLNSGSGPFNISNTLTLYKNAKTWAQGFGIQKLKPYEGGYSPDYDPNINAFFAIVPSPQSTITAATPGNPTLVTLPTTFVTGNTNSNSVTPAASVGTAHVVNFLGGSFGALMNNPGLEGVTIVGGGSANISGANTLKLNQAVFFQADTMPNELTQANLPGAAEQYSIPYHVVSTGNPFQISATRGGPPITFNSTGSNVRAQECWFVTAVSGTQVSYDVDSTGTTFTTSGTALYANASLMLNNLRFAGKSVPALQTLTTLNYTNLTGLTVGGFTAGFPSCFQFTGPTPSNNTWSVLEDIYQTPNPPQWAAIVAFNH